MLYNTFCTKNRKKVHLSLLKQLGVGEINTYLYMKLNTVLHAYCAMQVSK